MLRGKLEHLDTDSSESYMKHQVMEEVNTRGSFVFPWGSGGEQDLYSAMGMNLEERKEEDKY